MKNYKFLLKPLFFIFNLIFATWLVLKIEQIQPSDFGRSKSFFEAAPNRRTVGPNDKVYLRLLAIEYKSGIIDSVGLDDRLRNFLAPPDEK